LMNLGNKLVLASLDVKNVSDKNYGF